MVMARESPWFALSCEYLLRGFIFIFYLGDLVSELKLNCFVFLMSMNQEFFFFNCEFDRKVRMRQRKKVS